MTFQERSRNALAVLIGTLFPLKKASAETIRLDLLKASAPRILLIRPHQGFGDLILATPAIRALTQAFPQSEIHLLVDGYLRPVMEYHARFKTLWVWDKKTMRGPTFLSFVKTLRGQHFDLALVLSGRIPSFTSFLFARLLGTRYVWAYDTHPFYGGANWSDWLASFVVPAPPEKLPEVKKFNALVEPLTGPIYDLTPEFFIPPAALEKVKAPRQSLLPQDKKKIGINLGGNPHRPERLWPVDHWVALTRQLLADTRLSVVAIVPPPQLRSGSGADEVGIYKEVCAGLGREFPAFYADHLTEVAAFIQGLDLWICPDGGLLHIAVAAKVPTLGLFFLTDPAQWYYQLPWAYALQSPQPAPSSLSPDAVMQAVRASLLIES